MREIILDTETTGLEPKEGHRIVEIGCVELVNSIPTGRTWHCYLNPERDMPEQAFAVHGLSSEFLSGQPLFADKADEFLAFVESAMLVIHNAKFDFGFLNAELERASRPLLAWDRIVDTLALARRRHPGRPRVSMRSAGATASTSATATCMGRCWIAGCWLRSMWNWSGESRPAWNWPATALSRPICRGRLPPCGPAPCLCPRA